MTFILYMYDLCCIHTRTSYFKYRINSVRMHVTLTQLVGIVMIEVTILLLVKLSMLALVESTKNKVSCNLSVSPFHR